MEIFGLKLNFNNVSNSLSSIGSAVNALWAEIFGEYAYLLPLACSSFVIGGMHDHDAGGDADQVVTDTGPYDSGSDADGTNLNCVIGERLTNYDGPEGTEGVGICQPQILECQLVEGEATYVEIRPEIQPQTEEIDNGVDENCDGHDDECRVGQSRDFYTGPEGTEGIGICRAGREECRLGGTWARYVEARAEVTPEEEEICGDGLDNDCLGDSPGELWLQFYGSSSRNGIYSVEQISGGFVVAGEQYNSATRYSQAWVATTDEAGNVLRGIFISRELALYMYPFQATSIRRTDDRGFILTTDGLDARLIKTNSSLLEEWHIDFGDNFTGNSVVQLTGGGYVVAGYASSVESGMNYPAWLFRSSESGAQVWSQNFFSSGYYDSTGNCVLSARDGGVVFAGTSYQVSGGATTDGDAWVVKANSDGAEVWRYLIRGGFAQLNYVAATNDGGYIAAGSQASAGGANRMLLVKLNAAGGEEWSNNYGIGSWLSSGVFVREITSEGFIAVGDCDNNVCFLKVDSEGIEEWRRVFEMSDDHFVRAAGSASNNELIVAGHINLFENGFLERFCLE